MKWLGSVVLAILAAFGILTAQSGFMQRVLAAAGAGNFTLAEQEIQTYQAAAGDTPAVPEALSWLARAALEARQLDRADAYASQAHRLAAALLRKTGHGSPPLATALGASIEVHSQVLAARGRRTEALAYLNRELAAYRQTPIAARIQKNINLLALVGKPAPPLDTAHWIGSKPPALAHLRGHPVLLFFWAHWCGDCKAEMPVIARLLSEYGPKGLILIGPTQLYGYTAGGADASPMAETEYIGQVRKQFYAPLQSMTVPLSETNFERYGCSTTPTIVLLDKAGIVRLYHPGAVSYEMLSAQLRRLFASPVPKP